MSNITETVEQLQALGFTKAASETQRVADLQRRLSIAYEHYRYVSQKHINAFNNKLKAASLKMFGTAGSNLHHCYDTLTLTDVKDYPSIPPTDVLAKVKEAQDRKVFDAMEVAHVVSVQEYKDPIIFGRITGCDDRFFIAQWGDDVKIADLLASHEG